jgi:uncharacterized repeat protein (TIGR03803 family)
MKHMRTMRLAAALLAASACTGAYAASQISVLFGFPASGENPSGANPETGLVAGPDGSLYGTTIYGGTSNCNCGTVFRLTPPGPGQTAWTQTVLHSFQGYPNDGEAPLASLTVDSQGNIYGTTLLGGPQQAGTVFELQNGGNGSWTETVLHSFSIADGQFPYGSLTFDSNGNLFGTTALGGSANQGTLFEMQPAGVNSTLTVVHNFAGGKDGAQPYTGVTFDPSGNLYGTTSSDGLTDVLGGTVFQIAPGGTPTVLHVFTDIIDKCCKRNGKLFKQDGGVPIGNLTLDTAGNIYATTQQGCEGADGGGVFKLAPPAPGKTEWAETTLHCFVGTSNLNKQQDGFQPTAGVLIDAAGNLYGTTESGGTIGAGTVYKLSPPTGGKKKWTEQLLISFNGGSDGIFPFGNLVADTQGNLYGTTMAGDPVNVNAMQIGGVYRLTP